ncbi:phage portal protein [Sinorhizobium meliloti]|uniref:phage portal protein n=1 Tax=Rhizobium meliloti TaxID=382 RepID=UPI002073913E|nr:phage portal protein [Sinorhizobium meliloti]MCM5691437.1 phage portal protein [Sinorhizobium meliloti]
MWPFKSGAAPAVEEKALPAGTGSFDPELYALLTGGTVAGISQGQALSVPAVQACIRAISEAVATSPITIKRRVGDQEVDVPGFPALRLLTGEANGWTSGFELLRDLASQALTSDTGGLAFINRVRGKPVEVIHYTPGSITVEYDAKGTQEPSYRIGGKKVKAADVVHLRGAFSRCPLSMARQSISTAYYIERHVEKLFANSAKPGGVLSVEGRLTAEAATRIGQSWKTAHSGEKSGGVAILDNNGKFTPITFTSADAQTLELLREANLQIARAFRVPPSMIYELSRMTWSNWESAGRDWITYSLMPWLRAMESALNRALLSDAERGEYRFAFDVDDTTQADLTARATAINSLIQATVLSPDEGRDWLGMAPRADGRGGEFINPAITVKPANDNRPREAAA